MSAEPNPAVTKTPDTAMNTCSMPITPKSLGISRRARIRFDTKLSAIVPKRPTLDQNMPAIVFSFRLFSRSFIPRYRYRIGKTVQDVRPARVFLSIVGLYDRYGRQALHRHVPHACF